MNQQEKLALSLFWQWGKPREYELGQVEAWLVLRARYGEMWQPVPVEALEFLHLKSTNAENRQY